MHGRVAGIESMCGQLFVFLFLCIKTFFSSERFLKEGGRFENNLFTEVKWASNWGCNESRLNQIRFLTG